MLLLYIASFEIPKYSDASAIIIFFIDNILTISYYQTQEALPNPLL